MNAHELYVLEEKKRRWQIHLAQFGLFILFVGDRKSTRTPVTY